MTPNERTIIRPQPRSQQSDRRQARSRAAPSRPLWLGIAVAAVLIVAETTLVRLLSSVAPHNTYGAVYLLGVLVISLGWNIVLALLTTFASAAVYLQIHLDAANGWQPANPAHLIPLAIFLPIGLLTNA